MDEARIRQQVAALGGARESGPDASVVIPVNAQADLETVWPIIVDVAGYAGAHRLEIVLVVNNYPADDPPPEIETFADLGIRVVAVPDVRRPGEPPGFTARLLGAAQAASPYALLFDADCRLVDPTALVDFYVAALRGGAQVAYTHVEYDDFLDVPSVRARIAAHHVARWCKRSLLRIPTTRGSNYAIDVQAVMELYEQGGMADEMNVGPTVKRHGGRVVYSGDPQLVVITSGRVFRPGWARLARYLSRRVVYNARVLPGGTRVHDRTKNVERRYRRQAPRTPTESREGRAANHSEHERTERAVRGR